MAGSESGKRVVVPGDLHPLFWSNVATGDGCWEWMGEITQSGYGVVSFPGARIPAHRAAYAIEHGFVPAHRVVMHQCDNRICVRPSHLRVGSQRDNVRDAVAKGRNAGSRKGPRVERDHLKQRDLYAYLDYLHGVIQELAMKLDTPQPMPFETWRKARYGPQLVAQ